MKTLPFTPAEFESRQAKVRSLMARHNLDALVVCAPENMYYLTGYETTGFHSYFQALIFPLDQAPRMVTRRIELGNAEKGAYKLAAVPYNDNEDAGAAVVATLKDMHLENARLGLEKEVPWFRVKVYDSLCSGLPNARFSDASGLVEKIRSIKSQAEIEYMRHAGHAVTAAALAAIDTIAEGKRDTDVAAAIFQARIAAGSEFVRNPTYVVTGARSALTHQSWNGTQIRSNDLVYFEFGANVRHYDAACMRSIAVGKPSELMKRAADATLEALERALEAVRPGGIAEDVHAASFRVFERARLSEYSLSRTGYGIGIEFLTWIESRGLSLYWGSKDVIEPGMTFHVIPFLAIPELGTVGFSETVLCNTGGCEPLNKVPRQLIQK